MTSTCGGGGSDGVITVVVGVSVSLTTSSALEGKMAGAFAGDVVDGSTV